MIPQMHDDKIQGEELSSPIEEKHTMTASEERSQQTPTLLQRWISVLLCILGVAMPLVAGSMVCWPLGWPFGVEISIDTTFLVMAVLATVGAFMLGFAFRAWWAVLLVPVAWIVGDFLGSVVRRLVNGWWHFGNKHFWDFQSGIILFALVPLIILGIIGVAGGIRFRRWCEARTPVHMTFSLSNANSQSDEGLAIIMHSFSLI